MMYPLALCSLIGITLVFERLWSLRRKKVFAPEIVAVLDQVQKDEDFSLVKSVCEKFDGPFARVMIACITNRDLPMEELRVTVEDEGRQQVRSLGRGLSILETVAVISPLLGLLGTVIGMIDVFNVIETLGVGQAKALSGGISKALITTATGLFIGVPALIAHNYFSNRSDNLVLDIEKYSITLLNKVARIRMGSKEEVKLSLSSE